MFRTQTCPRIPNAIQAIKFLNHTEVDFFLDIHMPDFTGFDFIQSLKNPPKVIFSHFR
jgi:YesN/AraC family two-component response regulator